MIFLQADRDGPTLAGRSRPRRSIIASPMAILIGFVRDKHPDMIFREIAGEVAPIGAGGTTIRAALRRKPG